MVAFDEGGNENPVHPRSIRTSANSLSGGVWCIVGSSACFSFTSVMVKMDKLPDGSPFPPVEISAGRGLLSLLLGIALWTFRGVPLLPSTWSKTLIVIARGTCDFLASTSFYVACGAMPVAVATLFLSTNMFITGILGRVFAGEKFGMVEGCLACIAFTGVALSVFPTISIWTSNDLAGNDVDSLQISWNGCIHALASCCFTSLNYLFGRLYKGESGADLLQAVTAFGIAASTLSPVLLFSGLDSTKVVAREAMDISTSRRTSIAIFSALLGQGLIIRGMMSRHVTPSMTALTRVLDIPCTMMWVFVLLGDRVSVYQVVGGMVVTSAASCLTYHKSTLIRSLPDDVNEEVMMKALSHTPRDENLVYGRHSVDNVYSLPVCNAHGEATTFDHHIAQSHVTL
eukprot:TRINITY_DN6332_c0_g1_i1.p1 TRINITY_DN6332_c0_g1~~TRINITY_DN6332_c0_g1_i1.p1  ORF type:complete len:435 (-),score=43.13 TRINITY_DN6332_c0_g1_i1:30-1229(-)